MKARAVALAALMVFSIVAGSVALAGSAAAAPAGFVSVSDSQVSSDLPTNTPMGQTAQEIADAGVMASSNHETTEVVVTTPGRAKQFSDGAILGGGPIAIVLRDDINDAGRTVALPKGPIEDALGYQPEMARGTHDSGEPWNEEIEYQDGWMLVDVPHFSTNTVTFAAEVQIGDTFTDGSQVQYDLNDLDSASDPVISMTGQLSTEVDTVSGSGVGVDHTTPVSLSGNGDINGSSDPTLQVTASVQDVGYSPFTDEGDGTAESSIGIVGDNGADEKYKSQIQIAPNTDRTASEIVLDIDTALGTQYDTSANIYIENSTIDTTIGDGTLVKSGWVPDFSSGNQTISFDSSYELKGGSTYTVEIETTNTDSDATKDALFIKTDDSASSNWIRVDSGIIQEPNEYGALYLPKKEVSDLSVSDDTGATANLGTFSDGETKSTNLGLSTSSTELNFTGIGSGSIDYTLTYEERSITENPGVVLNDNETVEHTGTLADGETTQLTLSKETLQSGTNTINVSMPELSADAPAMQVEMNYSHDAQDAQSVEYEAEKFSERYEVSKTYSSDRKDPTLTIPFADTAVSIRDAEYRLNGGDWTDADGWVLSNTTGTIHLPDMQAEDTVDVRANASKVAVSDGAIKVLEATATADKLDSKIEITEHRPDFAIDVSGIDDKRLVYATDESWSEEDAHAYVDASGNQELRLPEAGVGSTTRIQDLPMWVTTDNDVEIAVTDGTVPRFQVRPGTTEDDLITIEYRDTVSGQAYALQKPGADDATDTDTAESPVYFDASDALATYEIIETTLGGATQPTGPIQTEQSDTFPIMLLIGVVGALGGLLLISRGLGGPGRTGRQRDRTLSLRGYSVSLPSLPSIGGRSSDRTTQTVVLGGVVIVGIVALEFASTEPLLEVAFTALAMGAETFGELLTIFVGIGALLGLWYLDKMTSDSIPTWLMGVAAVVTTVYIVETIQPGVLLGPASSGFETIAPLFWLVLLGGGSYFVYGYIQSRRAPDTEVTFQLEGRNR